MKINNSITGKLINSTTGGYVKKGFYFIVAFLTLTMTACNNDDDDDALVTPAGSVITETDLNFVTEAAHYNNAQIEFGKLALQKSANESVKSYGQSIIDQHTAAQQELNGIVNSKNINMPVGISEDQQEDLEDLIDEGDDFDDEFLEIQEDLLDDMEDDFDDYVEDGNDPDLKNHANKQLPLIKANEGKVNDLQDLVN